MKGKKGLLEELRLMERKVEGIEKKAGSIFTWKVST